MLKLSGAKLFKMATFNNKKFNNINFLGHLPFNPDLLLDKNRFVDRPVGINYPDLLKMYWSIRSFKVKINIQTIAQDDPLTTFLLAGGSSGGIFGAIAGLSAVNQSLGRSAGLITVNGYTKIQNIYQKKVRKQKTNSVPSEGIQDGILLDPGENSENFEIDESVGDPYLQSVVQKPKEADLCSAGPVHTIISGGAYLKIDLSDIIYFQRKYWPKIIFLAVSGDSRYSTSPFIANGYDLPIKGSVTLMGYPINLYADITFSATRIVQPFAIANGSIEAGERCCDRFFYDGYDDIREQECKEECGDGPKGVYRQAKPNLNESDNPPLQTTESVGGGGEFGGAGASATF
jgi:hypothetical protein